MSTIVLDILLADLERRHAVGLVSKDGECSCTVEDGLGAYCSPCEVDILKQSCRPARRVETTAEERKHTGARTKMEEVT